MKLIGKLKQKSNVHKGQRRLLAAHMCRSFIDNSAFILDLSGFTPAACNTKASFLGLRNFAGSQESAHAVKAPTLRPHCGFPLRYY